MFEVKRFSLATVLLSTFLTACVNPVDRQNSGIEASSLWDRLTRADHDTKTDDANLDLAIRADSATDVDQTWWTHFQDPTLSALITEALNNNKTLAIAKSRIDEAEANHTFAQSSLLPQLNGVGTATRENGGYSTFNQSITLAQVDVEATWELDLFGRNQARTAQAAAILQSSEASAHAIRVALLSDVAHTYFDMRNYEHQIAITKQNLETEQKTLQLTEAQKAGALASDFDVQRAAAEVSTTEALIPALRTAYDASLNRLNILMGYPPSTKNALLQTPEDLRPLAPTIVIAAPAKVLENRPDIVAAERNFAASISGSRAATAELFPDISLTGLFGAQTATPYSATPWGIGVTLVQPILNFGRISSQIDAAHAEQQQAFLNYQQSVLLALEDMENALSSYIHETTRNASLTAAVAQNKKAADLAQQQYSNGYTALLDVLVAQRNLLNAEAAQTSSNATLRNDLVTIYAAAGGGWQE